MTTYRHQMMLRRHFDLPEPQSNLAADALVCLGLLLGIVAIAVTVLL